MKSYKTKTKNYNKYNSFSIRLSLYYRRKLRIHITYLLIIITTLIVGNSAILWKNELKYQSQFHGDEKNIISEVKIKTVLASANEEIKLVTIGYKGSLADKNNNPGNLKFNNQIYATKGDGGFAKFDTSLRGYKELLRQIRIDQNRDYSLTEFISKYAPPSENNTRIYIQRVANNLKITPSTNISDINTRDLASEMMMFESGSVIK